MNKNTRFNAIFTGVGVAGFLLFFSSQVPDVLKSGKEKKTETPAVIRIVKVAAKMEKEASPAASAQPSKQELAAEGQALLAAGGGSGAGDMFRINGSAQEDTYIKFCSVSRSKVLVHTASRPGKYLGELKLNPSPSLVPLDPDDFKSNYSIEFGREITKNLPLMAMAGAAARQAGQDGAAIQLYLVFNKQFFGYMIGLISRSVKAQGKELANVAEINAKFLVDAGDAKVKLVSALLKDGSMIELSDTEV